MYSTFRDMQCSLAQKCPRLIPQIVPKSAFLLQSSVREILQEMMLPNLPGKCLYCKKKGNLLASVTWLLYAEHDMLKLESIESACEHCETLKDLELFVQLCGNQLSSISIGNMLVFIEHFCSVNCVERIFSSDDERFNYVQQVYALAYGLKVLSSLVTSDSLQIVDKEGFSLKNLDKDSLSKLLGKYFESAIDRNITNVADHSNGKRRKVKEYAEVKKVHKDEKKKKKKILIGDGMNLPNDEN